jgi:hypothetical protein
MPGRFNVINDMKVRIGGRRRFSENCPFVLCSASGHRPRGYRSQHLTMSQAINSLPPAPLVAGRTHTPRGCLSARGSRILGRVRVPRAARGSGCGRSGNGPRPGGAAALPGARGVVRPPSPVGRAAHAIRRCTGRRLTRAAPRSPGRPGAATSNPHRRILPPNPFAEACSL